MSTRQGKGMKSWRWRRWNPQRRHLRAIKTDAEEHKREKREEKKSQENGENSRENLRGGRSGGRRGEIIGLMIELSKKRPNSRIWELRHCQGLRRGLQRGVEEIGGVRGWGRGWRGWGALNVLIPRESKKSLQLLILWWGTHYRTEWVIGNGNTF